MNSQLRSYKLFIALLSCFAVQFCLPQKAWAQGCDPSTPSFTINLSGNPDSTWTSSAVQRAGNCCGTSAPDLCIQFNLTLDSNSSGIRLDIVSGAVPGGALFYKIGCGTSYAVGQDICLNGPGPHSITFCKPGNNINTYQIKAIPKPDLKGRLIINEACQGHLKAVGLVTSSITWQSVPNNTTHNGYLSCLSACDSVSIIPTGSYPPTVTYRVCGTVAGGCGAAATFCDTATVRFVSNTGVDILPTNPTVCFGGSNTTITATPSGGLAPFTYLWSTNDTSQSINVGVGTYYVQMLDSLKCTVARDTVVVTSFASSISIQAGNDTTVCRNLSTISLRGSTTGGVGIKWKQGLGSFVPNDTTLNASYIPAISEVNAGTVTLKAITTRNGSCPADSDLVSITIANPPTTVINGPSNVCALKQTTHSTPFTSGNSYLWTATNGTIQGSNTDTTVKVIWSNSTSGTLTLKQLSVLGCDSTVTKTIVINPTPIPVINGPTNVCALKQTIHYTNAVLGNTYLWTVSNGIIHGSNTDTAVRVVWNNATAGTLTLKQTNTAGCDSTVVKNITINPTPVPVVNGPNNACLLKQTTHYTNAVLGNTYLWSVTNGIIQGSSTDTSVNVVWNNGTSGTLTLKQINVSGCDSTVIKNIIINPTPIPIINGPNNVCPFKQTTYSSPYVLANTYLWAATNGTIQGSNSDTTVKVIWNNGTTGTLTLKQTNASDCDSTVIKNITINPSPIPIINGPTNVCALKQTTHYTNAALGNTYLWTVTNGIIQGSSADTSVNVVWNNATAGTLTLKQTNASGCDSTVTKNITINPTPLPSVNGPNSICAFKQTIHSASIVEGNTYLWTVTNGTIQGSNTDTVVNVVWNNGTSGTLTLKQTNASGCDSTVIKSIIINPLPIPSLTGPANACAWKETSHSTNFVIGTTYLWTATNGTIQGSNTDTFVNIIWSNASSGSVTLKQTNSFGCDSIIIKNITIQATPLPIISGPDTACARRVYTYTSTKSIGDSMAWSVINGTLTSKQGDTLINVFWNTTGSGEVLLRKINSSGCDSSITKSIVIESNPLVQVNGPAQLCEQTTDTYTASVAGLLSYKWSVTNGQIIGSDSSAVVSIKVLTPGTANLQLHVSTNNHCDTLLVKSITIHPKPALTLNGPDTICSGASGIYQTASHSGSSYTWMVASGSITQQRDSIVTVNWPLIGLHKVAVRETNTQGCSSSDSMMIFVSGKPRLTLIGANAVCEFTSTPFKTNTEIGTITNWIVNGASHQQVNDTLIHVHAQNGNVQVSAYRVNNVGCDSTLTLNLLVRPKPHPIINGISPLCSFRKTVYHTPSNASHSYLWTVQNATVVSPTQTDSLIEVTFGNTDANLLLKVTNQFGCDSSVAKTVQLLSAPSGSITGDSVVCINQNPRSYSIIGTPTSNYQWQAFDGSFLSTNTAQTVSVEWQKTGFQLLKVYVYENTTGCDSAFYKTIYADSVVKPQIIAVPDKGCLPLSTTLSSPNTNNLGYQFKWYNPQKTLSIQPTYSNTYSVAGTYPIWLKVNNTNGCVDSAYTQLYVNQKPTASADYIKIGKRIYTEDTVQFINNSTGGNKHVWYLPASLYDTTFNWNHAFALPGNYWVKLFAIDTLTGCMDSDIVNLEVWLHENLYVPNAFSPNADGKNDFFSIGLENITEFEVLIVNRWGQIVYQSTNPNFAWDGNFEGAPCQEDAYVYLVTAKGYHGKTFSLKGSVTLIR